MILHVALDRRTGFPCVSLDKGESYISVFPTTKIQVEQWISKRMPFAADKSTDVIRRLEECYIPKKEAGGAPIYPESIRLLDRKPISELDAETAPSIVATNLTLWMPEEFPLNHDALFPTPQSEWGLFLIWLNGRVPDSTQWKDTAAAFKNIETKELLIRILDQDIEWAPVIKGLLKRFLEVIPGSERGLPLMNIGVYELISDTKSYSIIDQRAETLDLARPIVAGESALWPTIEGNGKKVWRAVFKGDLPVVSVRAWYAAGNVRESEKNGMPRTIELMEKEDSPVEEEKTRPTIQFHRLVVKKTVRGTGLNIYNCPECCRMIPKAIVKKKANLFCITRRNVQVADFADDESGKIIEHGARIPEEAKNAVIKQIQIHSGYLDLLRKHPKKIRSVTLSGFTKAGKSTWLLSLIGMALYPPANSRLTNIFPDDWRFQKELLSMGNPATDLLTKALENMWVFGDVPQRNQPFLEAIHSPILFTTSKPGPLHEQERSVVLIFNDIAGEVIINPQALANDKYYPHVCATKDVIFIHPANSIGSADNHLAQFIKGLISVPRNGRNLNPKNINLIFGLSMIDRLKYSVGKDREHSERNKELFDIFMNNQHRLTYTRNTDELRTYLDGMKCVHFQLMEWIRANYRDLYTTAAKFGSVRFCGFSSFGFEVVNEGKTAQVEACLPFEPQPVRVIDPLLWLLQDNGVI